MSAPTTRVTIVLQFDVETDGLSADQIQALTDLSYIMQVQAEDGLYTGGSPDAEGAEYLASLAPVGAPQITLGA
jgi:hypothetical protein